jgi:hypothetical protein
LKSPTLIAFKGTTTLIEKALRLSVLHSSILQFHVGSTLIEIRRPSTLIAFKVMPTLVRFGHTTLIEFAPPQPQMQNPNSLNFASRSKHLAHHWSRG